ncbi:xanthine dehydrogenase subunit XdhA [Escherichia coli]|nr:xanthine dehydrogenase subunit XdhA [Escherichia coli]
MNSRQKKAAQLVSIEWQELPVITTPEAALAEDAAPIHNGGNLLKQSTMSTGNVQQTIDAADYQVQGHYQTPVIQHCHMESVTSLAWMEDDSRITIVSSTQIPAHCSPRGWSGAGYSLVMRTSHQTILSVAVLVINRMYWKSQWRHS